MASGRTQFSIGLSQLLDNPIPHSSSPIAHLWTGERYLTDKELSEHLKLSRRTLQEYRRQGILPYIILCGKTLYPESEIQALLTGNYRKPIIDGTVSQGEGTAS